MITTSADGNAYITNLKWAGWGKATATGTGSEMAGDCIPNCAQGTVTDRGTAIVTVSDPVEYQGAEYYNYVTVNQPTNSFSVDNLAP